MNPQPLEASAWSSLKARLIDLQRTLAGLLEYRQKAQRDHQRRLDEVCLGTIEVLDLLERLPRDEAGSSYLDKVSRRLQAVLTRQDIHELTVDVVVPRSVKVIESRAAPDQPPGKILEVCRKGYRHGERILRPAEVIAAR